jgi:uncharacterized protein involved in response to NO
MLMMVDPHSLPTWLRAPLFLLVGITVTIQGYRMNEQKRRKEFAVLPLWIYKTLYFVVGVLFILGGLVMAFAKH